MYKEASATFEDQRSADKILKRIYDENPSYWPHGLTRDHFDSGLYLVKQSNTQDPVGFVGWQRRREKGQNVGYYAIGILPEYRRQGFAKKAVAEIMRKKAATCDKVRAMIVETNQPSIALAESLGVDKKLEKAAAAKSIGSILGALGTAVFADQAVDPDGRSMESSFKPWEWDKNRKLMGLLNAALGATGGYNIANKNTITGLTAMTLAPTKDLALKGLGTLHKVDSVADAAAKKLTEAGGDPLNINVETTSGGGESSSGKGIPTGAWLGAGGLGLGALALAAYNSKKRRDIEEEKVKAEAMGRVRVTLPTKQDGDHETVVDIPLNEHEMKLTQALKGRLGRDTRRRLYSETKARTRRRKPKETDDVMDKAAAIVSLVREIHDGGPRYKRAMQLPQPPQPPKMPSGNSLPTPPAPGINPALQTPASQMQQQRTQVNSINSATTAGNPVVQKAEQAAQQARDEAGQQTAAIEQQKQKELAEQQQEASQRISQLQHDNQMKDLQLEKTKMEAQIAEQKAQLAAQEQKSTALTGAFSGRLDRVGKKLGKSASYEQGAPGQYDYNTPFPKKEGPPVFLAGTAADDINDSPEGVKAVRPLGLFRASYGKMGDWAFDTFAKRWMYAPRPGAVNNRPFKRGGVDRFEELQRYFTATKGALNTPGAKGIF